MPEMNRNPVRVAERTDTPPKRGGFVVRDAAVGRWLRFDEPLRIIEARRLDEVVPKLVEVESLVNERGLYAAGFLSYEAAPAFDPALRTHPHDSFPHLWFGLYPEPAAVRLSPPRSGALPVVEWTPDVKRSEYGRSIARIRDLLAAGETYQVNYTFRLHAPAPSDPWTLFLQVARAQEAGYAAFVDTGRFVVTSASPELFFRLDGRRLTSRPMKGTAPRGRTSSEDEEIARRLRDCEKNRSENVMIVDMVRNDMGRVAEYGTVRVPRLFDVERYPTVWQMTSTVEAETDASVSDILAALFPCASVTGAPKPHTMEIIRNLESSPRRIYTGGVGFIAPGRRAQFNVAIRTVLIDREEQTAEYGVGGGIVWDSVAGDEYEECMVKARVLTRARPEFSLLETMLWTPDEGWFLLPYHLRRLQDSAGYFGYPADLERIEDELAALAKLFPNEAHRVRLLLERDGRFRCEAAPLSRLPLPERVRLRLAPAPVDSSDPFLFHKTTHREVYDDARAACSDCDDVLLWNERGEITETCNCNVVVRLDGRLVTPPVDCGLLAGTYRAWLLDRNEIDEKVVTRENLERAEAVYVLNSVRKQREAVLMAE